MFIDSVFANSRRANSMLRERFNKLTFPSGKNLKTPKSVRAWSTACKGECPQQILNYINV